MSFRFACPHCGAVLKAPGKSAGTQVHCLKCGLPLEVPVPKGVVVEESTAPTDFAPPAPQPSSPFAFDGPTPPEANGADSGPIIRRARSDAGLMALIWGIVAIVVFPPLCLVAIPTANSALRYDRFDNMAKAGLILGWIAAAECLLLCVSLSLQVGLLTMFYRF